MFHRRNAPTDLGAVAGLAIAIFLAACVLTYDPADPPSTSQYPAHGTATNACGLVGAYVAHTLFSTIGVGAYFALGSLFAVAAMLLSRQAPTEPTIRTVGWSLTLVGLCTFAAILAPSIAGDPLAGPGGWLGASVQIMLERHFAFLGECVVTASILLAGLILMADRLMHSLFSLTVTEPLRRYFARLEEARTKLGYPVAAAPALAVVGGLTTADLAMTAPVVKASGKRKKATENTENAGPTEPAAESIPLASLVKAATIPVAVDEESDDVDSEYEYEEEAVEEAPAPAPLKVNPSAKPAAPAKATKVDAAKAEREVVKMALDAASKQLEDASEYELPSIDLLLPGEEVAFDEHEADVRRKAQVLEQTFAQFGVNVKVVEIDTGPVIAQFELELEAGLRLSKVTSLADDLAIALRVPSVRIVAPIPGKNTVGVEIPNANRRLVRMREVMEESETQIRKQRIPIFLGQDVSGHPMTCDLTTMPHLLIAGRTGTGKSVCLNTLICSILMTRRPDEVKMLLIDPKMVELSCYKKIPHLMHPVVTDMKKAEAILGWAVEKMEERYSLLARAGVRHIGSYNQLGKAELLKRLQPEDEAQAAEIPETLPYIIVVADEFADLIMTSPKEVETHIIRLAQKSRAVGIHLILATQKPTVDVITGLIKSNLPARIAFQVASRTDSRVVLDEMGADKLLGYGDMLFLQPGTSTMLRGQGTYITDEEINDICAAVESTEQQFAPELVTLKVKDDEDAPAANRRRDPLFEAAVDVVVREGRGSVSLLQRCLGIGYGRAARIIDEMAEDGIVGAYNGAQAREVLYTVDQWEARQARIKAAGSKGAALEAAPVKPSKPAAIARPVLAEEVEAEEEYEEEYEEEEGEDDDYGDDEGEEDDSPSGGRLNRDRVVESR